MLIQRVEYFDRNNAVDVYMGLRQFAEVSTVLCRQEGVLRYSELGDSVWRRAFRIVIDSATSGTSVRKVYKVESGMRLDTDELGHDLVDRIKPEGADGDPDAFNPDYSPIDFTVLVLDARGEQVLNMLESNPHAYDSGRLLSALSAARVVVSLSLSPPNLA